MYHIRLEKIIQGESGKVQIAFSTLPTFQNGHAVRLDSQDVDKVIQLLQEFRSGEREPEDRFSYRKGE